MIKLPYFEFPANEPERIKKFYAAVLGWQFKDGDKYWMIESQGDEGINGAVYLSERMRGVVPTFEVADLKAVVDQAQANGGKIFMETENGEHVYIEDPEGTIFAVWQVAN